MAARTTPAVIRIKRKRDEPVLPGFVLSNKRKSLSNLSLDGGGQEERPAMRYRLVGTVQPDGETVASASCCGGGGDGVTNAGTGGGGGGGVTSASTRPGEGTLKRRAEAPPQFARLRRSTSVDTSAAAQQVLELQRCSSVPDFGAAVPKLRPFGPRIPPSRPRQEGGGGGGGGGGSGSGSGGGRAAAATADSISLDDIWADAATAAMLTDDPPKASVHAAAAADDEAEFVYDEYTIAAEGEHIPTLNPHLSPITLILILIVS